MRRHKFTMGQHVNLLQEYRFISIFCQKNIFSHWQETLEKNNSINSIV